MRLRVVAQTQADYDRWVSGEKAGLSASAKQYVLDTLQTKYGCTACHMVQGVSKAEVGEPHACGGALDLRRRQVRHDLRQPLALVWDAPSRKPNQCPRLPQPIRAGWACRRSRFPSA